MTQKRPEIENHALVGKALIYLAEGLRPFVEGKLQEFHGYDWEEVAKDSLGDRQFHIQDGKVDLQDAQALLQIIIKQQKEAFASVLSRDEISLVYEVAQKRRDWAHLRFIGEDKDNLKKFTPKYTYRTLDSINLLLDAISAQTEAQKLEQLMQQLLPQLQQQSDTKDSFQQDLIAQKTAGFVGREFVFNAIQYFLASQDRGYFIIEGDPGVGKTAIAAKYVQQQNCVAHFNVRSQGINRADQFLENVCTQLITRYNLPYPELPGEATRDGQFLDKLLREISAKLKKRDKLVIVVDALDEVDSRDHAGANILYLPVSLPQGVYFVMTSRPEKLPLRSNSIQRFDLMQYQAESLADIQNYIRIRAKMSGKLREWIGAQGLIEEEFVRELAQKSENNFMYLRYVLGDIEQGKYDDLSIDRLPAGLEQYYDEHWRRMGMLTEPLPMHKVAIVYFLAELREPVSRRMLVELSDENPVIVQNVLKEWKQFLREVTVDGETRYGVYHQSFCDFLGRQEIVEAYGDEY